MGSRLISQNIKGTPAMKYKDVTNDLKVLKAKEPDIIALQEMKWVWYWTALLRVFLPTRWGKFPKLFLGARSSQPIIWDRREWKRIATKRVLLHEGKAADPHGWEDRYIIAVLLENKKSGFRVWVTNRHYLPAAYTSPAGSLRRKVWSVANGRDRRLMQHLADGDFPWFSVGDFNWPGEVYPDKINGRRPEYHGGSQPIDKIISLGNKRGQVEERDSGRVSLSQLETDHAGRVLDFVLVDAHPNN